jgi:nicotinamidase-related amidase
VVDMQRAGLEPEHGLGPLHAARAPGSFARYREYVEGTLVPNNVRLLERFRHLGWTVVYTTAGSHFPDGRDLGAPRRRRDIEDQRRTGVRTLFAVGEHPHGIIDALTPQSGELVINKLGSDAFIGTALDQVLRWHGLDTLIVTGVGTPYCVESTVRHASDLAYACVVAKDACGTSDMTLHEHSIRVMAQRYAMVRTTDEILGRLPAAGPA